MKINTRLRDLGPLIGVLLFVAALWILHHTLAEYNYQDIVAYLNKLPNHQLALALLFTTLSYMVMAGYDLLAMYYIRRPLPWMKVGFAAFVSYAFSNTIGLSLLTSGSVRYRLYSSWGLSAVEIAKVVIFTALTLWLGILAIGGGILTFMPLHWPVQLPLSLESTKPLGLVMLIAPVAYLLLGVVREQPFRVWQWELPMVRPRLALPQLGIAILDWAIAGSVLYVLLPHSEALSFMYFLGVFLLAQTAGLISHVPGGLGVFESLIVLMLSPSLSVADVLGALLAYRLIYYLIPLALATVGLGIHEAWRHTQRVLWLPRVVDPWIPVLLPQALALLALVCGAMLLFTSAIPSAAGRLEALRGFLPLPVLEIAHFISAVTGIGLLLAARGLQRRLDVAWVLTVLLSIMGIAASLLKGLDYEDALVLAVLLAALVPCRRDFYRKTALFEERFTIGWSVTIALILIGALWLALFSFKHVAYSNALWWQFSFNNQGDAPRFLRAMAGVLSVALAFIIIKRLYPRALPIALPTVEELQQAKAVVAMGSQAYPHLALVGDKALLFNAARTAFLMYGVEGRIWVAMGDPVSIHEEEQRELAWRFRELCEQHGGWTVFYKVHPQHLDLYIELGLNLLKIGEEARVPLADFLPSKWMRGTVRHLENEGCRMAILPAAQVPALLPRLKRVSEAWLDQKDHRERGFALGFFNEEYLRSCPVAVVSQGERIVAFANLWLTAKKHELAIDLVRHLPDVPIGVVDYLIIQILVWGREQDYAWFNLGMVPVVSLPNRNLAPAWKRFAALACGCSENTYNVRALRREKNKFGPRWEPRYLAAPGSITLPYILADLTALMRRGGKRPT